MARGEGQRMAGKTYDIIVIGGGPAGLMCTLTAVCGIPINPPRHFSALLLDRGEVGQFARYGKLRLTHGWHLMGDELVSTLAEEVERSGLEVREHERVVGVDLGGDPKVVETEGGTYRCRTVAICTGFFPHGHLMRHRWSVRPVFGPAELESRALPAERHGAVAVLGGGAPTLDLVRRLQELRPDLGYLAIVEDEAEGALPDGVELVRGTADVVQDSREGVMLRLADLAGKSLGRRSCRLLLVDYNSYTIDTGVTGFLDDSGLERRGGYIVADERGRTGLEGVVAAGNIVTPVSGALTALSTGFTAGLTLHSQLYEARFGEAPLLFPWLPAAGYRAHPLDRDR